MALEMTVNREGRTPVLELAGRLSDMEVVQFAVQVELLMSEGGGDLVIDISRLTSIDSQGLGKIVTYNAKLARQNRRLVLVNANSDPHSFVRALFTATNLDKVIRIVAGLEPDAGR